MIPDEVISQIRDQVDLVQLIGEHVRLQKRGGRYLGLCPFHDEKTPSFSVRGDVKHFYCFGCKESGDPFGFVMRVEGVSFPQAVRTLAERVGVEIPENDRAEDAAERRSRERKDRLYALMDAATRFYEERADAAPFVAELERRRIGSATARAFRLGYAPPSWDALTAHLQAKGWSLEDAEAVGLVIRRRDGSGVYDRFRHRLLFPVTDLSGRVVAFSGRILPAADGKPDRNEPKYVNSPEGPLYTKGDVLYGLHQSRVAIRRTGWALLCEGNFDLLALHDAGFQNAVAPLGTAFTDAQARLLKRFAERATLLFDGDAAGLKAVRAAFPLLQRHGLSGRVARLPQGADPDSYLREHGAEALRGLIDRSPGVVECLIDDAAEQAAGDPGRMASAIEELGPVLATVKNSVEADLYVQRVAQRFGVTDLAAVRRELRRAVRAGRAGAVARPNPQSSRDKSVVDPSPRRVILPKLQTELLGALLDCPELLGTRDDDFEGLFATPELREIYRAAHSVVQENGDLDVTGLFSKLQDNGALPWLQERLAQPVYETRDNAQEVVDNGAPLLAKNNLERELPRLSGAIRVARSEGDEERATRLTRERDAIARAAHRLMRGPRGEDAGQD